jgi:hypothetical protein
VGIDSAAVGVRILDPVKIRAQIGHGRTRPAQVTGEHPRPLLE